MDLTDQNQFFLHLILLFLILISPLSFFFVVLPIEAELTYSNWFLQITIYSYLIKLISTEDHCFEVKKIGQAKSRWSYPQKLGKLLPINEGLYITLNQCLKRLCRDLMNNAGQNNGSQNVQLVPLSHFCSLFVSQNLIFELIVSRWWGEQLNLWSWTQANLLNLIICCSFLTSNTTKLVKRISSEYYTID